MGDVVGELGTILSVWAHPDDEAYLAGGLMAMARDAGSRVVCVTATRGERGTSDPSAWPPGRLARQRSAELARCLEILGVAEHHWLGYEDGGCARVRPSEAVTRLRDLIGRVEPDTVLSFGPDGNTGHPDHMAVARWTAAALDQAARPGARLLQAAVTEEWARQWRGLNEELNVFAAGYPVTVPTSELAVELTLDPDTAGRKVRALAAQETQTAAVIAAVGVETYTAWVRDEAFVEHHCEPGS